MAEKVNLIGLANPVGRLPAFLIPIFGDKSGRWLQDSTDGRTISCFRRCTEDDLSIIRVREDREFAIGDELQFGFGFREGEVVFGTKSQVRAAIADQVDTAINTPFLQLETAAFLGDGHKLSAANERAKTLLQQLDPAIAETWFALEQLNATESTTAPGDSG
jgi:hypothetical protein